MTTLMTDKGLIEFSNKNITPPSQCFRCHSNILSHDFTAGHYSNEYSSTQCRNCNSRQTHVMGMWVYELRNDEYTVRWFDCPPGHPLKHDRHLSNFTVERQDEDK